MPRLTLLALALCAASPAAASWLHCTADGSNATGPVSYHTTLTDVGSVPPARLAKLRQALLAHIAQADPDTHGMTATCYAVEDQLQGSSDYSRLLNQSARRLGWEHVNVLGPDDWLADADINAAPSRP